MSLSFSPVLKFGILLIPGETHELELRFENTSEYDKKLFCTLHCPDGLLISRNHFDVLVPAEGLCIETIKITVPKNIRIFYASYFFVIETTDAVLEENKSFAFFLKCDLPWKRSSEGNCKGETVYLGKSHTCKEDPPHQKDSCKLTLTSQLACTATENAQLCVCSKGECEILLNGKSIGICTKEFTYELSLTKGINKLCINVPDPNSVIHAELIQTTDYVPSCINPDYFLD